MLKIVVVTLFITHWFACFYRLAAEKTLPTDPDTWVEHYKQYFKYSNDQQPSPSDLYMAAFYYASSVISMVGNSQAYVILFDD
jgi:hypothetical protein